MKKILITGISGFAGSFLAEHLLKKNNKKIFGTTLTSENPNISQINHQVTLYEVNLLDSKKVESMINETQPDNIFHLAALASPRLSFENPAETITNNITAQVNILEAVRNIKDYKPRILIVSSADVYGIVGPNDLPMDEQTPLHPANPYAVSKIAQDYLAMQYVYSYKLPIVRVRPFNHIGPRQGPHFVITDFVKRIVAIEKGKIPPVLRVGNLDAKRDFTDVRDMVRAYDLILEKGIIGDVYNIGSGKSFTIADILKMLLALSKTEITVESDPMLMRPADTPELLCDGKKMQQLTHWHPEIPLEQTLKDTLDYWRDIE